MSTWIRFLASNWMGIVQCVLHSAFLSLLAGQQHLALHLAGDAQWQSVQVRGIALLNCRSRLRGSRREGSDCSVGDQGGSWLHCGAD